MLNYGNFGIPVIECTGAACGIILYAPVVGSKIVLATGTSVSAEEDGEF
jgi:hypothetical protein